MPRSLPEFERPPVIEVALSVQFERLDATTPQLGLVWQKFRDRFGNVEEKPELDNAFERFGPPEKRIPGVRFQVGAVPSSRFWFVNETGNELVQVQRDRFVRNWRKTDDLPEYPRYSSLRSAFMSDWNIFSTFVAEELKTPLVPNQCEVTYVNIIESKNPNELGDVLTCVKTQFYDDYLGEPESAEVQFHFLLKKDDGIPWGRLHVDAAPALRATDDKSVIRLNLTARGIPKDQGFDATMAALDACHEAIVGGFASITTPELHKAWGRKS